MFLEIIFFFFFDLFLIEESDYFSELLRLPVEVHVSNSHVDEQIRIVETIQWMCFFNLSISNF